MRIKNIARIGALVLTAIVGILHAVPSFAATAVNPVEQILNMDPQTLQSLENEIQAIVGQMSQEEQQQFHQDVESLTNEMSKMTNQELEQYLSDIFAAEMPEAEPVKPKEVVQPKEPVKPAIKPLEKPAPKVPTSKENEAFSVVDSIIRRTNSFLLKAQMYPEMSDKVEKWVKDKKIAHWQTNVTWQMFKAQLELLVQKLKKISSRDPKTQEY